MSPPALPFETTEDRLLDGRVTLRQPAGGYRVAIDPVLLAASVDAAPSDRVLDVGAGVGAVGLCLAARLPAVQIAGVELQPELTALALHNARANGFDARLSTVTHDIAVLPPPMLAEILAPGAYDHVVTNPPYLAAAAGARPLDRIKALATMESTADLARWIRFCLNRLKPGGTLWMIHRADRLGELLSRLEGQAGDTVVFPVWPAQGAPARRVIVRTRRDAAGPLRLAPGLVLHDGPESYAEPAQAVLRDGRALPL